MNALRPMGYSRDLTVWGGDGLPWVNGEAVGRMLYPAAKDPAKRVQNLHLRNKSRFTGRDTVLLEVENPYFWQGTSTLTARVDVPPGKGDLHPHCEGAGRASKVTQKREIRFFSLPYGALKLCMASDSPERYAVAEKLLALHEAHAAGRLPKHDGTLASVARLPLWSRERGRAIAQISHDSGLSRATVGRHLNRIQAGEPVNRNCPGLKRYCHERHREKKAAVREGLKRGRGVKEMAIECGVPLSTVYRWKTEIHG